MSDPDGHSQQAGSGDTAVITCPECDTRFVVPEAEIPAGGRTVRCSSCGNVWRAHQEAPHSPVPRKAIASQEHADETRGGWIPVLLLAIACGALLGSLYMARDSIAARIPALAPFIASVDGAVDRIAPAGLSIENVVFEGPSEEGELLLSAEVVNSSEDARPAPRLDATLLDKDGNVIRTEMLLPREEGAVAGGARIGYFLETMGDDSIGQIIVDFEGN